MTGAICGHPTASQSAGQASSGRVRSTIVADHVRAFAGASVAVRARSRPPARARLRAPVDGRDDQPARHPGQRAGDPVRGHRHPAGVDVPGRPPQRRRLPALPADRPAGRRLGRPAAAPAGDDRRRPRAGRRPCDDPPRLRRRRADDRPAVHRRLRRRRRSRSSSTSRTRATCPSIVARDQLQEGNAKLEISRAGRGGGRPRARRRPHRDPPRTARGRPRRALVPRVGALPLHDPAAGAGARGAPRGRAAGTGDAPRDGGGAALRPRPRVPEEHRGLHRDRQPLRHRRHVGPPRVRGSRAGDDGGDDRRRVLDRGDGRAPRRARGQPRLDADWAWARRSSRSRA